MASSACPICSRHFRQENLSMHVEACLTRSTRTAEKPLSVAPKISPHTPAFRSPLKSPQSQQQKPQHAIASSEVIESSRKRKRDTMTSSAPLAERMRPNTLEDLVGQDELLGKDKLLASLIEADRVPNMILWGPPGCGKTTLAHVISKRTGCKFIVLSGATSLMADMKEAVEKARGEKKLLGRRTIVFVDEIHRFKKNQQDFFLPPVEDGTITLIGATTENPSFEINNALLSRCRVYTLKKHTIESIEMILRRALKDPSAIGVHLLASSGIAIESCQMKREEEPSNNIQVEDAAIEYLAKNCGGDARVALNSLEMAIQTGKEVDTATGALLLTEAHVKHCFANRQTLFYDRNADLHYDCISAFHKSVRGSDANAALYWLARMLEGGENPLFIARRMIRIAAEDIGLAAPELLPIAVSAYHSAHFVGMPECDVVLAQCATMLARAPKSIEVYAAYKRAKQTIREWGEGAQPDVPLHLRNAPTRLMKDLGYGKDYKYNPAFTAEEVKDQTYLPDELIHVDFFNDSQADAKEED